MKSHLLGLVLLLFPILCFGQEKPFISFDKKSIDFGTIKYKPNSVIRIKFYFKNTGELPLVIRKVDASCGCTVPTWTKHPIKAGSKDFVFVLFKMKNKQGKIMKSLFVNSNTDERVTVLHIKGEII